MSAIPSSVSPAIHVAGSVSGAQRRDAHADRAAEAAAGQRLSSDTHDLAARSLGDVGQTDESADRDADGRREYAPDMSGGEAEDRPLEPDPAVARRARDVSGERGRVLDCEA